MAITHCNHSDTDQFSPDPLRKIEHDLRNCLNVISSGIVILQLGQHGPERIANILEQMATNNQIAGTLLSDLLNQVAMERKILLSDETANPLEKS